MSTPKHLGKFSHDLINSTVSVYVAGPFIGETPWETHRNVTIAEEMSAYIWEHCGEGVLVLTPHLNSGNMIGVSHERTFINAYLKVVGMCDATYILPDWEYSKGTKGEIIRVIELRKPLFFDVDELVTWVNDPDRLCITDTSRTCRCCGCRVFSEEICGVLYYPLCNICLGHVWDYSRYQPAELKKLIEETL